MRRNLITSMIIGLLAAPTFAQQEPPAPGDGNPQRREARDRAVRRDRGPGAQDGEMGRRGPRGEGGPRMIERLAEQLELDEAQRAQFDDIMAAHRERMQAMGEKRRAMREARDSGDQETVDRLRAEMESGDGGPGGSMEQAFSELEPVLREDQLAKLDEVREQQRRRGGGREEMQRVVRELPDALNLDDDQKAQFEELVQARREEMRERMAEMGPLFEEMRAAQESGDQAKVDELRAQLESGRPNRETMIADFFGQLDPILRDDQKPLLAAYREQLESAAPRGREQAEPANIRALFRTASKLELTDEQRDELKAIQRDATAQAREVGRRDKEGQALMLASVKERIVRLLDSAQATEFEEALSKASRRGGR